MLSRRTMPLSAFGTIALFDIGVWNYGGFHLADYPVFLGFAGNSKSGQSTFSSPTGCDATS
jgi:hypothetical protein